MIEAEIDSEQVLFTVKSLATMSVCVAALTEIKGTLQHNI